MKYRTYIPELLILLLALALRLTMLDAKPPHFDEGVNGWFVDELTTTGTFKYDPTNYHGPLHFYALFTAQTLFGRDINVLRMVVVLVSVAGIVAILAFRKFLPLPVPRMAGLFMAISPGFVFYGRYSIHEIWLVLFLILMLYATVDLFRHGSKAALWLLVLSVTGLILTKETYIIHVVAFLATYPCLLLWERFSPSTSMTLKAERQWTYRDLGFACGSALALLVFFYSGNFGNLPGLLGPFQTFAAWFETGHAGNGHEKPFTYWVTLMWRYEWPVMIGLALSIRYLWPGNRLIRFITIFSGGTLLAYSIVAYKTPWCGISIFWSYLIVAAYGIYEIGRWKKSVAILLFAILCTHSTYRTIKLNYFDFTNDSEPYVYVQTYDDLYKFTEPILAKARIDPTFYKAKAALIVSDYYPLPWVFGDFTRIGYHQKDALPDQLDQFAFLLIDAKRTDDIEQHLRGEYFTETVRFRSGQAKSKYYLRADDFRDLFPIREPEFKN